MRNKIMGALLLVTVLAAMEGTIVSTAVPRITSDLSGIELVSWVYAIYMLATAVSAPIYGKLADLFGRKKVMLTGIVIFLAGSALCGLAQSMGQLILFRAIQGLGAGAVMPVTMTIIGDLYTETKDRAKAQGWISAVWGVAGVLGPLMGGFLVDTLSWRYIFFLNIPFGLVAFIMLAANYKEDIEKVKPYIDYKGAAIFSVGTIAFLYALLQGSQSQEWGSPVIIGLFLFTLIAYIGFYGVERRSPEPLIPLHLFSNRNISLINLLTLLVGGVVISITVYLPIWSQGVMSKSATEAGFVLMPMPVCWTLGAILSGQLVERMKPNWIITLGTGIVTAASLFMFSLTADSPSAFIYMATGMVGLGMGLITPIFMLTIQSSVQQKERGVAVALNTFTNTFSQTLGSAIFGTIFNLTLLSEAKKKGEGDLNFNASFSEGHVPADKLSEMHGILASAVHAIHGGMLLAAGLSFAVSFALIKRRKSKSQEYQYLKHG
ncbi:drug resistance transporter, EmrB/QacA subfamily [Fictibacillus solisalsi]|uniref:Drug resistance transporter, EmrB/QacA subfamily n=1 Tax=Fictibacillus solisalsi TaxID=459525 RepID=A0A1G9VGY1_9BACL|nr:MDR family MFS transporter [Fictibacillus solisalsi]SDM71065.1 drug resistance transporter, EmrB/QacA subfamily [Fictibacillus solisalsi]